MAELVKKIKITATIELITGLHIGGNKDSVEIGGIDLPVIKLATKENQPYIPGSSIKGKMRCLLEQRYGIQNIGGFGSDAGRVRALFGYADKESQASRLIVRDAMLTEDAIQLLNKCTETLDMPFTENKIENTIDRLSGKTKRGGIRQTERVPAGATFDAEFIINVWDDSNESQLIETFKEGIALLKNDYLGGSGSRGYGQIRFDNWKSVQYGEASETSSNGDDKNQTAKIDWLKETTYELGEI